MKRPEVLVRFLDAARDAISARVEAGTPSSAVAARAFEALENSVGAIVPGSLDAPPAYRHLPSALERARAAPELASLAEAFESLEPELRWRRRPGSEAAGEVFHDGHANADIVGPVGLEQRSDVWYREDRGWHTPGAGGIVYNPPNIVHAMRAGPKALLALWLLWAG